MTPVMVEIKNTSNGYQLWRGGRPYRITGAGMVHDDFERFTATGGNSIRTWTTDDNTRDLLDSAHAHGVTVALCLCMVPERHGFDYDDSEAVAAQLETMRKEILKYRDHPALLLWIIGNELNHSYTNPAVFDAVNDVAELIHELDPDHPATTALSGFNELVLTEVQARAPELDFISFQVYGSLFGLPERITASGFTGPFMVTEWGSIGYWEIEKTSWGAPVELTSSEKADVFLRGYQEVLGSLQSQLIGSYAFLWGQKQERTPTWFGLFTESGESTEAVDVMRYNWTGSWPEDRSPRVLSMTLNGKGAREHVELEAGLSYTARLELRDEDMDGLRFRWEVRPESAAEQAGGDFETAVPTLDGLLAESGGAEVSMTAPVPGFYRLYAYALDQHGKAAHANIPFRVLPGFSQSPPDLIANEVMAVAYSGFRSGQHPDRGQGSINPTDAQTIEDLELLVSHGFRLIRLYDSGQNSRTVIELIQRHGLPIKVLLGIWLKAEFSNHEGCPWLEQPIPETELAANAQYNSAELQRGINLARGFESVVVAVNVGNEVLVEWTDHMVPLERVIAYVRQVKQEISQPVTVADNYRWWINDGDPLAAEVDFLGVHTYPLWEYKNIDEALAYSIENIQGVHAALPGKSIAILEAGWASTASEFGAEASEVRQLRYFSELENWASIVNVTVFFFEAFDEAWKGNPDDPLTAEKHFGLFTADRLPKQVLSELRDSR